MHERNQKGAALIIFMAVFALLITAFLVSQLNADSDKILRGKKTVMALAEAKSALIGFVTRTDNIANPSYLPNPDLKLGATEEGRQAISSGSADISLIGKLPWRALGIAPHRDGANECLWYVVSGRYKNFPSTSVFNWDTQGQITVIDENGNTLASNLAALIVSPGVLLAGQDRQTVANDTPQCGGNYDARNYLDSYLPMNAVAGEVNYFAGSFHREAPNTNDKIFVLAKNDFYNDQFLFVTMGEIFSPLIKRSDFSLQVNALLNDAELQSHLQSISVAGSKGTDNVDCGLIVTSANNKVFCDNWKEMLLLADLPTPSPIVIDGASTTNCSRVLIFGGQKTDTQARSTMINKSNPANYLEGANIIAFNASNNNFNGASGFDADNSSADILKCL
jgi:hypothetical protein